MDGKNIQLGNTAYHYYEIPNPGKPKMLLLHGMMVESHYFEKLATLLQAHYHLFLLDLKGHGKSGNGSSYDTSYTNDVIAADLHAFHQAVIQEPFYLVGYSLGGQYSFKFAGTYPELLKGVVIIDSAPAVSLKGVFTILYAMLTTPKHFKDREHVYRHYDKRLAGLGEYMFKYCISQDAAGRYQIRYDQKNLAPSSSAKGAARIKDLWQAARKITVPTLILRAEHSFVINDKLERMMKQSIPKCEVVLMKGMQHNMVFTQAPALAERIERFFAPTATPAG